MKKLITFFALLLLITTPAFAGFKIGQEEFSYSQSNQTLSLKELERLAKQDDADAQNNLGFMYFNGFGVPKDYVSAYMW